jgi:hypothetical protein
MGSLYLVGNAVVEVLKIDSDEKPSFPITPDTSSPTVLCTERLASAEGGTSED